MSQLQPPKRKYKRDNPLVFVGEMMRIHRVRELSGKAIEFLGVCVTEGKLDTGELVDVQARVTAAKALLHYSMWRENWELDRGQLTPEALLEFVAGSDEAFLKWMDQARPKVLARIEARIQARALVSKSFDPEESLTSP